MNLSFYEQGLKHHWRNEGLSPADRTAVERSWGKLSLHMPFCQCQLLHVRVRRCTNMSQGIWSWYQQQLWLNIHESYGGVTVGWFVFLKHHKVSGRSFSLFLRVLSLFLPPPSPRLTFGLILANLTSLFLVFGLTSLLHNAVNYIQEFSFNDIQFPWCFKSNCLI